MVKLENGCSTNDVIVTVYEESPTLRSSRPQCEKIKPTNSNPKNSSGYDRRAELLARVHQLRNPGAQVHQDPVLVEPTRKPKKKRKFLAPLRKFRFSFGRMFRERKKEWRYESIETEGHERRRYRLCRPRRANCNKFSKSLRGVIGQIPCLWRCGKFSRNEQEQLDLDAKQG